MGRGANRRDVGAVFVAVFVYAGHFALRGPRIGGFGSDVYWIEWSGRRS